MSWLPATISPQKPLRLSHPLFLTQIFCLRCFSPVLFIWGWGRVLEIRPESLMNASQTAKPPLFCLQWFLIVSGMMNFQGIHAECLTVRKISQMPPYLWISDCSGLSGWALNVTTYNFIRARQRENCLPKMGEKVM